MQVRRAAAANVGAAPAPPRAAWEALSARVRAGFEPFRQPHVEPEPHELSIVPLRRELMRPGLLGLAAALAIVLGASQPSSPFTSTEVPGSWYFGIPPSPPILNHTQTPGSGLFISVVLVYAGMALMMKAWYDIAKITWRRPGIPVKSLWPIFVLWMLPFLVVAPLFSRDIYSYAAQGEMMSHGISPYSYGPAVLGYGHINSWVTPTDKLWWDVTSPYGPAFLGAAGFIVSLTGHNELMSVVGLRLLAVLGVLLIGKFLPRLARSYGFDGSTAFVLAVLNPLVYLHLIGGGHNDALMLGLMIAGLALAREGHPIVGIILTGMAAGVKVPAIVATIYIGWEWIGREAPFRQRIRPVLTALLIAGLTLAWESWQVGLGWGWISALHNPDTVRSWMDPATAVGILAGKIVHGIGIGDHTTGLLSIARGTAFAAAVLLSFRLLVRSTRGTSLRAIGMTMLIVTVLGPVVQPWYLAWSIVVLAGVAVGRVRTFVVFMSCAASFLGLPGGHTLLSLITIANPLLLAVAALALALVGAWLLAPRLRRGIAVVQAGRQIGPEVTEHAA